MKDINLQLRRAYYDILKNQVTVNGQVVPIYNMFVPKGYPDQYIVVQAENSVGRETKCSQDREVSIQFLISTRKELNGGTECDSIADQLFNLVYPNRGFVIDGCLSMDLVSDNSMGDIDPQTGKQIIERVIIFKHIIV